VSDHEDPPTLLGQSDKPSALLDVETERLLDQDILAGLQSATPNAALR